MIFLDPPFFVSCMIIQTAVILHIADCFDEQKKHNFKTLYWCYMASALVIPIIMRAYS